MVDKDKKLDPSTPAREPNDNSSARRQDPALAEIHQRIYPEMRRDKPDQQAIAAALEAMRQLTTETDSESDAEHAVLDSASNACPICGHRNRESNKFCGACGQRLDVEEMRLPDSMLDFSAALREDDREKNRPDAPVPAQEVHPANSASAMHHYHHHYHHHYFQSGQEIMAPAPRASNPESLREADRLRMAAAAKGESMSRGEASVRRLTQEWVLACNTRQLDELIELYSPDAMVLRSNLPPIRGTMALREFFHGALEAGLGEVALDPLRVEVIGDLAHEVGRYSALVPGTAGKRREERGKYLWVFARQSSGSWKLVSECWSSDLTLSGAESDFQKAVIPATKPRK
jgi:ketosteroid isomerase-like protein